MAKGKFSHRGGKEVFNPEYGGVLWKPRLNNWLEENDTEIKPVYYSEDDLPSMQITQENTSIFLNSFVDELDLVVVAYDQDMDEDGEVPGTFYFREQVDDFEELTGEIGKWALSTFTLYPLEDVVEAYERIHETPDTIPENWGEEE
jgi:hypothetical protein